LQTTANNWRARARIDGRALRHNLGLARRLAPLFIVKTQAQIQLLPMADSLVAHPRAAQLGAQVGGGVLHVVGQRRVQIHLHQKMHAAAQVEPQVHGPRVQRAEPLRRRR